MKKLDNILDWLLAASLGFLAVVLLVTAAWDFGDHQTSSAGQSVVLLLLLGGSVRLGYWFARRKENASGINAYHVEESDDDLDLRY